MGQPLSLPYVRQVAEIAQRARSPSPRRRARFFNAAIALGLEPRELAQPADSVMFCLSKGLACPIGSLVVGPRDFVARAPRPQARRRRHAPVGVLAAPGLVALRDGPAGMIERLAEDHANARRLAEGLSTLDGIESAGGSPSRRPASSTQ